MGSHTQDHTRRERERARERENERERERERTRASERERERERERLKHTGVWWTGVGGMGAEWGTGLPVPDAET